MRKRHFLGILGVLLVGSMSFGDIIIVNNDGTGDYSTIQPALNAAVSGVDEILVLPGVYSGVGNHSLDFHGKGVKISSSAGPETCIIDCGQMGRAFLIEKDATDDADNIVIDGFTIINGYHPDYGGAIEINGASPTITNCVIRNSYAYDGGAIDCYNSAAKIVGCELTNNSAANDGGAVELYASTGAEVRDCVISSNYAGHSGGGIDVYDCSVTIVNCQLTGNTAANDGGAIECKDGPGATVITNCLITGNAADQYGGAIDCFESQPIITYCTIVNNTGGAGYGGVGGVYADALSSLTQITSCILWNNGDDIEGVGATYSCIEDGDLGEGNISFNPEFKTGPLGDYYLRQNLAGQQVTSTCVDTGKDGLVTPEFDVSVYTTRTDSVADDGVPDMGYHYADVGYPGDVQLTFGVIPDDLGNPNGALVEVPIVVGTYPTYTRYSEVRLRAVPDINADGYRVDYWDGLSSADAGVSSVEYIVMMDDDRDVSVKFKTFPMYVLTANVLDTGAGINGTIDVFGGAPTGEPGQTWQYAGSLVIAFATPNAGYQVRYWSGTDNDAGSAGQSIGYVTMTGDKSITVEFVPNDLAQLDAKVIGGHGSIVPKRGTYAVGTTVPLLAIPDEDYRVRKWTGTADDTLLTNDNTVVMNWSKTVTVEFELVPIYTLYTDVVLIDGVAHGTIEPEDGPYPDGTLVELLATPDPGWEVLRWFGTLYDLSTEPNNAVIVQGGDTFVYVQFRETGLPEQTIIIERDPAIVYPTIQAAIDAAIMDDVVIVARGVYTGDGNRDLDIRGNDYVPGDANTLDVITVRSEFGPEETIIDCEGVARGFIFNVPVDNRFLVQGFTIRNGEADQGGAMYFGADPAADPPVAATPIVGGGRDDETGRDGACIIENCHAGEGGGAVWFEGVGTDDAVEQDAEDVEYPIIRNCVLRNNISGGSGGAIHITNGASPRIISTEIIGNRAGVGGPPGLGGGVFSNAGSLPAIINCLFTLNVSTDIGGAIYVRESDAIIRLCTIIYNEGLDTDDGNGPKGGIAARDCDPEINHCIIGRSGAGVVDYGWGNAFTAGDDLFDCEAEYSCIENGDGGTGNIAGDPLHVRGQLGYYYLSQTRAGQAVNSPCVDAGEANILEDLENQYGLSQEITTSNWNLLKQYDVADGDLGYHYPFSTGPMAPPVMRSLTIYVVGNGYLSYSTIGQLPLTGDVYPGVPVTVAVERGGWVYFQADPNSGYRVLQWTGTVDDYSTANFNSTTVYNDAYVTLEFEKTYRRTFNIPGDFSYTQVQRAINTARSGDTIVLHSGVYTGADIVVMGKDLTLTSAYPNDPAYVASTIFDFGSMGGTGMSIIGTDTGRCVLNGVTIANAFTPGRQLPDPPDPGMSGSSGMDIFGLSLTVDGSHIIANCIIRDATLRGNHGANGTNGTDDELHAGDGGWGSSVGGAALYVGTSIFRVLGPGGGGGGGGGVVLPGTMSPVIKNCEFTGCVAIAGNGGNGGNGARGMRAGNGGIPGRVFGGAVFCDMGTDATFIDCVVRDNIAQGGIGGQGGDTPIDGGRPGWGGGTDEYDLYRTLYPWDEQWFLSIGDPRQWTANGAGVYVGGYAFDYLGGYILYPGLPLVGETHATFTNCRIANNITRGSITGRGGARGGIGYIEPFLHYQMPSYGAGFYGAQDASVVLTGCQVVNNRTEPHPDAANYPDDYHSADQYYGYGGGVCVQGAAELQPWLVMEDCHVTENFAPVGGGMYWIDAYADVADSNMVYNRSFVGGGVYCLDSPNAFISRCLVQGNNALFQQPDASAPDPASIPVHGAGGGMYLFTSNARVVDTFITQNVSSFSGGGVYLGGNPESIYPLLAEPELKNCLITENTASQDGGGVSINWFAEAAINNCTIADNVVTGTAGQGFGYGGGVHVAYNSHATIKDSIVWYNRGSLGAQLAVANADPYSEGLPQLDLLYSTVGPFLDPNAFEELIFGNGGANGDGSGSGITPTQMNTEVIIDAQTINDALASGGKAKIVVSLKDLNDIRDATDWTSPASVAVLHQAVSGRQNAVLSTLSPAEFVIGQRYQNFAGFSGEVTPAGLAKLAAHPWVAHIEPERYFTPMMAQALNLANALAARQAYDGTGVSIAIVDTGIDYTHPMLGGQGLGLGGFPNDKVIGGYDAAMKDADPMPGMTVPIEAHGTACAGIAAGLVGLNGDYIGGVAYGAKLYALKIAGPQASLALSSALAAWDWCLTNKYADPENPILVVSNSWGNAIPFDDAAVADAMFPSMADAADALTGAGITVMAASGNAGYGGQMGTPAALSDVISVGAVYDTTDLVTSYSNTADILDILAPGDPIATTDIVGPAGFDPGDYFQAFNGTSAACPFAAGCVASIQSAAMEKINRYLTPREVKSLLIATGTPVTDTKVLITKPRVNLGAALASMASIPIYVDQGCELPGWDAQNELWDFDMTHNIFGAPDFVSGYYLNYGSPCVDAGSASAELLGMNVYTTRLDGIPDANAVDMGYHYSHGVPIYPVDVTVVKNAADPSVSGLAEIELPDGSILQGAHVSVEVYEGQEVILRALPDEGMFVKGWYDRVGRLVSTRSEITIIADEDNVFTLEFKRGRTVSVSGGGDVLRQAALDAQNGDILIVAPGVYSGNIDPRGRKVKIFGVNPNDPDVVAATVIDCGPGERGFIFDNEEDSQVVVSGFTITNGGVPGESGGAMYFGKGTSPIIKNVQVTNCSAVLANGGAFYIAPESSPTFINVTIENSSVVLGSGGGVYADMGSSPTFIECVITGCSAFDGAGGAVYCAGTSKPVFVDSIFTDNIAGLAGGAIFFSVRCQSQITNCQFIDNTLIGGGDPILYYGDGGAVYFGFDNTLDVADCNFIGNTGESGGAVYLNEGSGGTFAHNLLMGNEASVDGGAIFMNRTKGLAVADCAVVENIALRGGGLHTVRGIDNVISGCAFRENVADVPLSFIPTDPNGGGFVPTTGIAGSAAGFGGGIYSFGEDILIEDCSMFMNSAGNSGGGVYLAGDVDFGQRLTRPELRNCLVSSNTAGKTGGGISCDWFVKPKISNCTIAENGGTNYGGGLYLSYDSKAEVVNSILWANYAADGSQIAVINDNEFDPGNTSLDISYSDVGPLADPNFYAVGDAAEELTVVPLTDPFALAKDIVGGGITVVGNPSYTGAQTAAGTFTGGLAAGIGIEKGIILTSGDARLAVAPNTSDFTTAINAFLGDVDLDYLLPGGGFFFNNTNDAAVLEFDFETRGGNLFFNYVFASEEYNEFANSLFNDIFAFFLDGQNIALIPGTNTAVSINTINGGNPYGFNANNPQYYVNNDPSDGGPFYQIEYDGFTTVLTARALNVGPGVHHIKMAIADVFDWALDSAVFIQGGSFSDTPTYSPPVYMEDNCVLNGEVAMNFDPVLHRWDPNDHMLTENPLFEGDDRLYGGEDPLLFVGGYMLSQIAAGQPVDSNCVDFGDGLASDYGLDAYTTRTDVEYDADMLDIGYHYRPFERAKYELIIEIDPSSPDGPHGTVLVSPAADPVTGEITAGTLVTFTAVPNPGYRVRRWFGVDEVPAWQAMTNTVLINGPTTIRILFEPDIVRHLLVPAVYATIEEAVAASSPGDFVVVDPGIHLITNPDGINFDGKAITLMSTDPDNEGVIAQTIIDCEGSRYVTKRAFHFFNGEGRGAVVKGFTIKNAFYHGALGRNGIIPGLPIDPDENPPVRFRAYAGEDAMGDGYGGAILCENESSPTFEYCVITNNTVTGGYGGDGVPGFDLYYNNNTDGQWGGNAGSGSGNGYGGAVACRRYSNPLFSNCTFEDNIAMGGGGGDGGSGGDGGNAGAGGYGGDASGVGMGGAIYAENNSIPVVDNCQFINNAARWGILGKGGALGAGAAGDPEPFAGADGFYYNNLFYPGLGFFFGISYSWDLVAGGAAYYGITCDPVFTNCTFKGNSAYEVSPTLSLFGTDRWQSELHVYTIGGAIYSDRMNNVVLDGCVFEDNIGGAVYCQSDDTVEITDCMFKNNRSLDQVDYEIPAEYMSYYAANYYYNYAYYGSFYQGDNRTSPGGALYVGPDGSLVADNTSFLSNSAYNGGAINTKSHSSFVNCVFNSNSADAFGGAIDAYDNTDPNRIILDLTFHTCSFAGNSASWGGAVHAHDYEAQMTDCYLIDNTALSGGGMFLSDGSGAINGGLFCRNKAVDESANGTDGLGGAIALMTGDVSIEGSEFVNNAAEGKRGAGGAISLYGGNSNITHAVTNSRFAGNSATTRGGAVSGHVFVDPLVQNCTFTDNTAGGAGGAINCDWMSSMEVTNSIFVSCSSRAVAEEDVNSSLVAHNLFYGNMEGDYGIYTSVFNQELQSFDYDFTLTQTGPQMDASNITGDPLFAAGPLGSYYLSQIASGQAQNSPAVDAGSAAAADLGMDVFTTRTDGGLDAVIVDIGYHNRDHTNAPVYKLTLSVAGGNGTISASPPSIDGQGGYYAGTIVTLTAKPKQSFRVRSWSGGTLDDLSIENVNMVVMGSNKSIVIEFGQPRVLVVGSQAKYTSIQRAIDDAVDGDIVMLQTGRYTADTWSILDFQGKDITLTGTNPDDENVISNTILWDHSLTFNGVGPRTVLEGFTLTVGRIQLYSSSPIIRNCRFVDCNWFGGDGVDLPFPSDGMDGGPSFGGAIRMYDSSPQVLNCTFDSCSVTGGDGFEGDNGVGGHEWGFDGGWAGRAYGGAVYAAWNSNPVFRDCVFNNCFALGGNGGNGGDGIQGAEGGRGGNWLWADSIEASPMVWYWWLDGWYWGDKFGDYGWFWWSGWYDTDDEWYQDYLLNGLDPFDRYYDYTRYGGYGGAFYCEANCSPQFYNCTFTDNNTSSGDCGIGGGPYIDPGPNRPLDIETAGGAIYIGDGCAPLFDGCLIRNNRADTTTVDVPEDYYISFGGGVAVEKNSNPRFVNCDIQYNEACEGGGMYWVNSDATIVDCNFVENMAYHGGGIYAAYSTGSVEGTYLTGNLASVNPQRTTTGGVVIDPNSGQGGGAGPGSSYFHSVYGQGGGLYVLSGIVDVSDSVFKDNKALSSGGGIYYAGSDLDNYIMPALHNSLLSNNTAGRDGGGISVNWYAEPEILNCTISDNIVTGALGEGFGYGGGLYVSYNSSAYISDSIIWDNAGANGAQIAVDGGDLHGPRTSEVTIVYSDIGPPFDPNAFIDLGSLSGQGGDTTGGGTGTGTTSVSEPVGVLIDGRMIYDQFDAGAEKVKVIVTLRDFVDLKKNINWDLPASADMYRGLVADLQSQVLLTLSPADFLLRHRYENIPGFSGLISRDGLSKLLDNPKVAHIEPDRQVFPMLAQAIPLANAAIARQAYNGTGISIAIVDSGVDYRHPRLGGGGFPNQKVIGGYDAAMNDNDPMPATEAHGTACAGIAAGDLGTVGDYIGGVAYGSKLYALKIADDNDALSIAAAVAAWDWCLTNKNNDPRNPIMVVSNSWGFYGLPFNNSAAADAFVPALTAAGDALTQAGITILAASGNDGFAGAGISHPSAMSNVISVGAVFDTTDMVTPYSNTADLLDILAPADPMYTTDIIGIGGYDPGDYYPYFNGTSAACPFAAGCVASVQAAALDKTRRYLTPGEVRSLLVSTGVPITDTKVQITKPRVNLGAALANLTTLPIYVDQGCILYGWDAENEKWDPNTFNMDLDPLLVGDYFLSEVEAGQLYDSPAVDYGSIPASLRGLDEYTTRSDSMLDDGMLNIGFHHKPFEPEFYTLQYYVIVDPFMFPDGFDPEISPYDPNGLVYRQQTQVRLTVTPPPFGYECVWMGTDNDRSSEPNNVVTMNDDTIVTVSFESIGYTLTVALDVDANDLPTFKPKPEDVVLDPPGGVYYPGTTVTITVPAPPAGYQVRWVNSDKGSVVEPTNTVIMDADKEVKAAYVPIKTDYYAVIVGIGDYFAIGNDLLYPAYDASQFYQKLLKSPNWRQDHMRLLVNSDATKGNIRIAIDELSDIVDHDDVFVFYFAGHGTTGPDEFPFDEIDDLDEFLVTYDTVSNIRDDELNEWLGEMATNDYVVILDTDYSGGHIDSVGLTARGMGVAVPATGDSFETGLLNFSNKGGQVDPQDLNKTVEPAGVVLTACSSDQMALEVQELRHGLFTYFLLKAIDGEADWDGNNNGWVSAEEAYRYLGPKVNAYVKDAVDAGLLPTGSKQGPRMFDADLTKEIDVLVVDPKDSNPSTWYVPEDVETIQEAIEVAKDGDVIILTPNIYRGGGLIIDKAVTITSTNPDDPDIIAMTIIDCANYQRRGIYFTSNAGPDSVLNGITLTHSNQPLAADNGLGGTDGDSIAGGGIFVGLGASPTIKNCVIRDFQVVAGNAGAGVTLVNGGDGGNGGSATGGGLYCAAESHPTIINTRIENCHVVSGNGGSGAAANVVDKGGRGGWSGWARGGGVYVAENAYPTFISCTITGCTATGGNGGNGGDSVTIQGINVPGGYGGNWSSDFFAPWQMWGYEGDYRFYSGYGAGIYCESNSVVKLIDCTISANSTQGGVSGVGGAMPAGQDNQEPVDSYEIPSYGGGVYCAADSRVSLTGCTITDNTAPKPAANYTLDPHLGHGGGIAFERTKSLSIKDCLIRRNEASVGGGIYWYDDAPKITDCNVLANEAFEGGGIYGLRGAPVIKGGIIHDNFARSTDTDVVVVAGQGGGIHLASANAQLVDVQIMNNQSSVSGGGLFLTGTEPTVSSIKNCLVVNNKSGRDGGGISSNWFAQSQITNCTFNANWATGYFGVVAGGAVIDPNGTPTQIPGGGTGEPSDFDSIGGGLYCGYESNVTVINSIFWHNYAQRGRQLGVGTGFEFDPRPASLTVSYSDVMGGRSTSAAEVEQGCTLNWSNNIIDDPQFRTGLLGDFYLSQAIAGDTAPFSPCVDAGSDYASVFGLDRYTTRSDDAFENYDTDIVDMGYHYPLKQTLAACKFCDLLLDGIVDLPDLAILAGNWLSQCGDVSGWCDGSDINTDNSVDLADFVLFASCWFVEDTVAPLPNPSEWNIQPRSLGAGSTSVEMSARVSVDAWWGPQVEYFFECLTDPAHNSGWRQGYDPDAPDYLANPEYYQDSGLTVDDAYRYVVRVRDGRGNVTADSLAVSVIAGHEEDPPTPDPTRWYGDDVDGDGILDVDLNQDGIPDGWPTPISGTSVTMRATVATDLSEPVEYYFRYTDATGQFDGAGNGHDSGWQASPIYDDTGLTPLATYYYRVRTRDKYGNETQESVVAIGVPDPAVVDFNPPLANPPVWEVPPSQYFINGQYWHYMRVTPVVDPEGNGEEYLFDCVGTDQFDSGWRNALNPYDLNNPLQNPPPDPLNPPVENEYWVRVSGSGWGNLQYRVRTRDQSPNANQSGWSTVLKVN